MWVFYLLSAVVLWQSLVSLRSGWRYLRYVRRETESPRPLFMPYASVVVPCRGLDQGLRSNVSALFTQHYPAYEIIFVSDRADDPAFLIIKDAWAGFYEHSVARVRFLDAGRARDCGQKVHNLRAGVAEADPASEVLVFADTDARPRPDWLRSLVAPLADEGAGATTGYRWYLPATGGLASYLRAVWNASIASALGERAERNFCWGGSTAIRRETFRRLGVGDEWRGTLSDDFALTRALRRARLPIRFVPNCLVASHEDCTLAQLFEFTTRQLRITRVYAPHLWKIVLFSNLLFVAVFFGGLALTAARAVEGRSLRAPLAVVLTIFALGAAKAYLRLRAVALPLRQERARLRRGAAAHLLLWPAAAAIFLYNALAAAASRRITWRGITYELKSPTETAIISPAVPEDAREESAPGARRGEA